jgi:hypothetical protein
LITVVRPASLSRTLQPSRAMPGSMPRTLI